MRLSSRPGWPEWVKDLLRVIERADADPRVLKLTIYAKADLPDVAEWEGCVVYVSDEAGGKTLAFYDGADWRRVQDLAVVS